jgi:hypothetical protein
MAEAHQLWMNQNGGRLGNPSNTGALPSLDIRDPGVSDSAALLERQVPSEHRRNDGFPSHALLYPNLLHTQPARGDSRVVASLGQQHLRKSEACGKSDYRMRA